VTTTTVLIALGVLTGLPPPALVALVVARWQPILGLIALGAAAAFGRGNDPKAGAEQLFLLAVAAELRAGASLRAALHAAALRAPGLDTFMLRRRLVSGQPLEGVGDLLVEVMPRHGALTAAAVGVAAGTGGQIAGTFERLALLAAEEDELGREERSATAAPRVSALLVGGLPLAWLAWLATTGRFSAQFSGSGLTAWMAGAGLALLAVGFLVIWSLLRRVEP